MSEQRDRLGRREAAADEWQSGREASFGESRHPVSASQLLGCFSEGSDKVGIGFIHRLSLVLFRREMSPAGQRIEREDLLHGVLARAEALASITGGGENVVG